MNFRKIACIALTLVFAMITHAQTTFYNLDTIQKVEIYFSIPDWDYQMDTAKAGAEGYVMADWVKVNGVQFDSVGVKYKGNSSYNAASKKNPLHINLKKYISQAYQSVTDIKLANCYLDPSMIREPLAFAILKNYMDCPHSNFSEVYINGAYVGLYSNDENIAKPFLKEHFYDYSANQNAFIKCSHSNPSASTRPNLKFINSDSSSYQTHYELQSNYGWNELVKLCDTVTNFNNQLDNAIDMDRVIWMLAFNNVLVNLDSYTGYFVQNYYLIKDKTNRFNPIIWDLNMCFGGFPFAGNQSGGMGSLTVTNMQNFPLNMHNNDADWPLIKAVFNNAMYKRMYVAHVRTIVNEMFVTNYYKTLAQQLQTLVDLSVVNDTNKTFSHTQFVNAIDSNTNVASYVVPGISGLMSARVNYLQTNSDFTATTPTISNINKYIAGILGTITASISNANTNGVYLGYRFDTTDRFRRFQMFDDGNHADGANGDGIYGLQFNMDSTTAQFYIYAENNFAGMFAPQRAEHEFYWIGKLNSIHETNTPIQSTFSLFPNPCNNYFTVKRNGNLPKTLTISNVLGQTIITEKITETATIKTDNLPSGIYYLNIEGTSQKISVDHSKE